MSEIYDAMCLTITAANNLIIVEYVNPIPKRMPANWDAYIRRQRVAGKSKTVLVTQSEKCYSNVLNFKHGDQFLIENKHVILKPVRDIQIPTGEYDITKIHDLSR